MINLFDLKNVQKAAAIFNPEKLVWLNAQYIKTSEPKRVAECLMPHLQNKGYDETAFSRIQGGVEALVPPLRERSQTLVEMADRAVPYLEESIAIDEGAAKKFLTPAIAPTIRKFSERVETATEFTKDVLEEIFHKILEEDGLKMGKLAQPLRVALTGGTVSPGIYEVMEMLGKERTLTRLRAGIQKAESSSS
jgi:glutamyl-tRNA synthetase